MLASVSRECDAMLVLAAGPSHSCDEPSHELSGQIGHGIPPTPGGEGRRALLLLSCICAVRREHVFTRTGWARSSPNSAHGGTQLLTATAPHSLPTVV